MLDFDHVALVGFVQGLARIAQRMKVTRVMRTPRSYCLARAVDRVFGITHYSAHWKAQRLDRFQHAPLDRIRSRGGYFHGLQRQSCVQFPHHIQDIISLFGLHGI